MDLSVNSFINSILPIIILIFNFLIMIILIYFVLCLLWFIYNKHLSKGFKTIIYTSNLKIKTSLYNLRNFKYFPTFYLPFSLQQMIFFVIKGKPKVFYKREYHLTSNGTTISFDWNISSKSYPLILIIHGFTGGSDRVYMKSIITKLFQSKYNIVTAHYRGINDTILTTNEAFHMGINEDTEYVFDYIIKSNQLKDLNNYKDRVLYKENHYNKFYVIGISFGGNICSRIFSKKTDYYQQFIKGFVSISNPFYLDYLDKVNHGNLLDYFILSRCKNMLSTYPIIYSNSSIDMKKVLSSKNCREFNEEYSIKIGKCRSLDEYYYQISSGNSIKNINIPSLFINSYQDSLNYMKCIDFNSISINNRNLTFITTSHGGHVTWSENCILLNRVSLFIIFKICIIYITYTVV